jgi:hypothetical protein
MIDEGIDRIKATYPYKLRPRGRGQELVMHESWRRIDDDQLVSGFLPHVPGLTHRLEAGVRVADVGCEVVDTPKPQNNAFVCRREVMST